MENALDNPVGNVLENAVQWRMYLRMQGGSTGECRGVGQVQLDLSQVQVEFGQVQLDFGQAHLDFGQVQLDFVQVQLDFGQV